MYGVAWHDGAPVYLLSQHVSPEARDFCQEGNPQPVYRILRIFVIVGVSPRQWMSRYCTLDISVKPEFSDKLGFLFDKDNGIMWF